VSTRVVLADDHLLFRQGLRALIEGHANLDAEVVEEASDVDETRQAVRRARPQALVLDLRMPGGESVALARELLSEQPQLKVLVLTMYDDPAFLRSMLAAGAQGYLLKRCAYEELAAALRTVLAGQIYIDRSLHVEVDATPKALAALSPREREVLVLLARGLTYAEVGKRLNIGSRTVETHRRKVSEKLGMATRADLVRFALEFGLLAPGEMD